MTNFAITRRILTTGALLLSSALILGAGPAVAAMENLPDSALIKRVKDAGVLRAGVAVFLPIVGQDPKTGEYFGTGVDIANWMGEELGVKVEFVPQDWAVMVGAIQANQIDIAVAGLYATPERLEVVDMTDYVAYGFCYAALATNDKVNTLEDLNKPDVTFIQHEGGGTYQITSKKYTNATHKARLPLPGEQVPWPEVLSGEADVVPFDPPLVFVVKQDMPQLKIIPEDCGVKHSDMPSPIAFAYPKGDEGFKQYAADFVKRHADDINASLEANSSPEALARGEGK
jgi:ABC-type amino acid transport substrate-binding protein